MMRRDEPADMAVTAGPAQPGWWGLARAEYHRLRADMLARRALALLVRAGMLERRMNHHLTEALRLDPASTARPAPPWG